MGNFKFKFDSIIRIKEILEKRIQEELAGIDKEIAELRKNLSFVIDERMRVQRSMIELPIKASEFQSAKMYEAILDKQIIIIQNKIDITLKKRQVKQAELVEKRKEQKVFETLKENQRLEYLIEERRAELKETNEIGIRNYHGPEL